MKINNVKRRNVVYKLRSRETSYKRNSQKVTISGSDDVFKLLKEHRNKEQEHYIVLLLNASNELITYKPLFVGILDACLIHAREIFKYAVLNNASKIIVAHNHPSGSLVPSVNDILMTENIRDAGVVMGIKLVDSVIISAEGFRSII